MKFWDWLIGKDELSVAKDRVIAQKLRIKEYQESLVIRERSIENLTSKQSMLVSDCSRLADENITMRLYIKKITSAIHGADINPFSGNGVSIDAAMNEIIDSAIALNHQLLRYRVDSEKLTEVQKALREITETGFSGLIDD